MEYEGGGKILSVVLALLIGWSSAPAVAAEFIWDRSIPGGVSLYLLGTIVPGDYERFVATLKRRGPQYFLLYLRSPGGNTGEAMRIGRLVRSLSVPTVGPLSDPQNPNVASCVSDVSAIGRSPQCICASACTLIWFAGVTRSALEIYVHSIRYDDAKMFGQLSPPEAEAMYRKSMGEIHDYLREMDVNEKIYYMMTDVASARIQRVLTVDGGELSNWSPGYREWLYARCGAPARTVSWGRCISDAGIQAEIDALKSFLAASP